jgi:putative membrane protein
MENVVSSAGGSLAGLPQFLAYLVASLALIAIFVVLYSLLTPQRDLALIRRGNAAAAVNLGGALLGFAIPLSKSVSQSHDLVDMVIWSSVALVVQLAIFFLSGLVIAHESRKIAEGDMAAAAFLAFAAVAGGFVTSASMTYSP